MKAVIVEEHGDGWKSVCYADGTPLTPRLRVTLSGRTAWRNWCEQEPDVAKQMVKMYVKAYNTLPYFASVHYHSLTFAEMQAFIDGWCL